MYRIAVVRKGQDPDRRICGVEGIEDAIYGILRAEKASVTEADQLGIRGLIAGAQAMCDEQGFAALEFGGAAVTVRPAPPQPEDPS
ncbi:hypothetical protein [Streptomyces sp. KL116D]|uniref:hypothetical protein n=1 Tax=Streptomyces sp. KL116D TaxID=3045152 RepID=UPI00355688B8